MTLVLDSLSGIGTNLRVGMTEDPGHFFTSRKYISRELDFSVIARIADFCLSESEVKSENDVSIAGPEGPMEVER